MHFFHPRAYSRISCSLATESLSLVETGRAQGWSWASRLSSILVGCWGSRCIQSAQQAPAVPCIQKAFCPFHFSILTSPIPLSGMIFTLYVELSKLPLHCAISTTSSISLPPTD